MTIPPALEPHLALLTTHLQSLTALYTALTPSPTPSLTSDLDALLALLNTTTTSQLNRLTTLVSTTEASLSASWNRVTDWRAALGEPEGVARGDGPLEVLMGEVERVLDGMRGRMQARGTRIVELQKRLWEFEEVLGREWGEVRLEKREEVEKGWEGLDLRLERMSALEREVLRAETEISRRRALLNRDVTEIFAIRTELGIHQDSLSSLTATTSSTTGNLHNSDSANSPISDPFDEAILCHLGVGEERVKKELVPTEENLKRVEAKRKWLEEEKNHRNSLIQSTYDKLYPLWTMLGVSEAEMESFVNRWMGSTSDVVHAYQTELHRMLTLKRSNLSSFILSERSSLTLLWDSLYLSPSQRISSFPPFTINVDPTVVWNEEKGVREEVVNENVSEELLVAHERERERVEREVEGAAEVLGRLGRYFDVLREMKELEASASDPSRLTGKTTRGDPGRLLREEKARKRVVKEKPKLEMELRSIIPVWEQENDRPFLVNGVRFLDELDASIEAEVAEKESKKRTKLGSSTPSTSTSHRTAPLRPQMTGASTTSLRPQMTGGPSSIAPLKRQMTGINKSAPPAKRLVPSHTGNARSTSSNQLADVGQPRSLAQSTGRIVSGGGGGGGGSGMKIPVGWGANSLGQGQVQGQGQGQNQNVNLEQQQQQQQQGMGFGLPAGKGEAFRPRASTRSSGGGGGAGPR